MSNPKALGRRGSWFAKVGGEELPCVHDYWLTGLHYRDPGYQAGEKQWDEYVQAIRTGMKVILTRSGPGPEGPFVRKGYVAIYLVSDVRTSPEGLEMNLKERLTNLD